MRTELEYYEVLPRILPAGEARTVRIRPRGWHAAFARDQEFEIRVYPLLEKERARPRASYSLGLFRPDEDGGLTFTHTFGGEQEHFIDIHNKDEDRQLLRFSVYSLFSDLFALRPYRGDLHVHSRHSDGREAPAIVCANYRRAGYDFTCITDHRRFFPSLEAVDAYRDAPIDLNIFTGEEVHSPENHVHIINFGGSFSVNELFEKDKDLYYREVAEISDSLGELPPEVDRFVYAACVWCFNKIREGGGLAVFPHPHWVDGGQYNVCDPMSEYLFRTLPFDAFELLNGMKQEENNVQVAFWQQQRALGHTMPVVGSSDSHGTVNRDNFDWFKTFVFARENTHSGIIEAVKAGMSVAVEQYPGEYQRVYGDYRLVRYGLFLIHNYFPIHDELCFEEGRAMKDYVCGDRGEAVRVLSLLRGRTARYLETLFG